MPACAICDHLSLAPRPAAGTVGLLTGESSIVAAALDYLGRSDGEDHVLVAACPEHVVDVYRGRIPGIRMAWRLSDDSASQIRRSPAAASASPA